jgi:AraC family transcriptional regulator of adaptative response / methylphosphotriester-DNA alkyltransferase methyltransferase
MHYRWDLLPQLADHVEHAQEAQARALLDELMPDLDRAVGHRLRLFVLRVAQVMAACIRAARRGGAPSEALYDEHLEALDRLSCLTTHAQVKNLLRRYVKRLTEQVQPVRRSAMERIVRSLLDDMRATIAQPRTLEHYAHNLEISPAHLSRSFTRIAGRPFRDELQRLRNEAARALLVTSKLSVADIALRVGQRSASQFIAAFRRANGVTPAAYRERHA